MSSNKGNDNQAPDNQAPLEKGSKKSATTERGGGIKAKLYKGMPNVELQENDKIAVRLELNEELSKKIIDAADDGPISISIESLDIDLQHNQSFGMVSASTGCISNPGGPSC
jgi:hypothetical protein